MPVHTLITLAAILLAGCNGAATVNAQAAAEASLPVELELRFDKVRQVQDLSLRLLRIDDSRCPIGLTCVWAGQMVAAIAVTRNDGSEAEVELLTRVGREPAVSSALGYDFRLLSVEPHPKDNVTISRSEQILQLMISSPGS